MPEPTTQGRPRTEPKAGPARLDLTWDVPAATAVLVLGALVFLWALRKGFAPVVSSIGS